MDEQAKRTLLDRVTQIPIVSSLRFDFQEMSEGFCRLIMPHEKRFHGIYESVHGGLLMTLADSAACFAIMTHTGPDELLTTTDMNIRFLAPCLSDAHAHARVIKLGRTLCPVAVALFDKEGLQVAVAQVTYMRLDKMPKRS